MKLKLKNVFLAYFLVSIAGLLYALVQLGERSGAGVRRASSRAPAAVHPALGMNPRAHTIHPTRPSDSALRPPGALPLLERTAASRRASDEAQTPSQSMQGPACSCRRLPLQPHFLTLSLALLRPR